MGHRVHAGGASGLYGEGGFASEAAAQAEVKALEAQDEWEAEQP